MLQKGQGNAASIELMGLGSRCDEISRHVAEAKTLARGNEGYEKEVKFYEEWHKQTKAKLHAAIVDTKGLGGQVAISGFGISESTHPDIFENTRQIYALRTKVESFGGALHDSDAHEHVQKLLAEAQKARADLTRLKGKYKQDKAACDFLTGGGTQDKLIDDALRKLEGAGKGQTRAPGEGKKPPAAETKKPHQIIKSVEHGLKAIERYKKQALKTGRKIDAGLGRIEKALGKGLRAGKKVDSGLERIAGLADQMAKALGDDSPIGHFAEQVGSAAHSAHEQLHDALGMAAKGKSFLHKGHQLFHQGMQIAQGHHEKQLEKIHGKRPAGAEHQHGGVSEAELVKHAGKAVYGDVQHLIKDSKRIVHDVQETGKDVRHAWGDAQGLWKEGKRTVHDVQRTGPHAGHAWGDAKSVCGDIDSGQWGDALQHGKGLIGAVRGLV